MHALVFFFWKQQNINDKTQPEHLKTSQNWAPLTVQIDEKVAGVHGSKTPKQKQLALRLKAT